MCSVAYLTSLQHAKRLAKRKVSADIRSKQHPPVVHICRIPHRILLDLGDAEKRLLADNGLPVINEVRAAEGAGEQLSSRIMLEDHAL